MRINFGNIGLTSYFLPTDVYLLHPAFQQTLFFKFLGQSPNYIETALKPYLQAQDELTFLLEDYFGASHRQIKNLLYQLQHIERKPRLTTQFCFTTALAKRVYNWSALPYQEVYEAMGNYEEAVFNLITTP